MVNRCQGMLRRKHSHWRAALVLSIASLYCTLGRYTELQLDWMLTVIVQSDSRRSPASIEISQESDGTANRIHFTNTSSNNSLYTCLVGNEVISIPIAPHFIIPGVQKGGTTALYHFLNEHPNLQGSVKREPHFFDWHYPHHPTRWLKARNMSLQTSREEIQCIVKKEYRDCFNITQDTPPGTIFFEKTPGYLVWSEIPKMIVSTCHWKPKVVVILRNPVKRAFSNYQMQNHYRMPREVRRKSFEELIDLELASLRDIGLSNAPDITSDIKTDAWFALPSWVEELDLMHRKHRYRHKQTNYLQRGMYASLLRPWMEYFPLGESMLVLCQERFSSHPEEVFSKILEFVGVPPFTPSRGFRTRHNKQRNNETISESTRQYLTAFFRPHNELLADMLGEEWRGIWD